MTTFYVILVAMLLILALFDLFVGVSNDAVNFLSSAVGSKAFKYKTLMVFAAVGVFCGATFSSGMMDIARHGIYMPQYYTFAELMCVYAAVMFTDVILLDIFNSYGMPTSTTVSMVFELLGASVAIASIKILSDDTLELGNLINTSIPFGGHRFCSWPCGAVCDAPGFLLWLQEKYSILYWCFWKRFPDVHILFYPHQGPQKHEFCGSRLQDFSRGK